MKPVVLNDAAHGDLETLKEAVCDSLINLTFERVSGFGPTGAMVFGRKPSRHFVSGFLAPGFDPTGQDDETSDIRINTHGLDFTVSRSEADEIEVSASIAVYVRALPEWDEIQTPGYGLVPVFQPTPEIQRELRAAVREHMAKRDSNGRSRGSYEDYLADKQAAYTAACSRLGLPAPSANLEELAPERATEDVEQDDINADPEDEEDSNSSSDQSDRIYARAVPNLSDALAERQRPPEVWIRVPVSLGPWAINLSDDLSLQSDVISNEIEQRIKTSVQAWLDTDEGRKRAYRDVRIAPSNCVDRESWEAFLETARHQSVDARQLLPDPFDLRLLVSASFDRRHDNQSLVRVSLEHCGKRAAGSQQALIEPACFQIELKVALASQALIMMPLDRVKPSYRYQRYMSQPAIGVNCGVSAASQGDKLFLRTSWAPRYVLPRQVPRSNSAIPRDYATLSDPGFDPAQLAGLTEEYGTWIEYVSANTDPTEGVTSASDQANELRNFERDIEAYRSEQKDIQRGIDILVEARQAFLDDRECEKAVPYKAWLMTNESFREAGKDEEGNVKFESWRLFQMAFILTQLPAFASRLNSYADWFDPDRDEDTASLLYFATGGGKSEAFFGALTFLLFMDRLRGKTFGVSALVRYPLRLLTVQQARRLFRLLVHAELVRRSHNVPGAPFQLGFWVGKSNTPNGLMDERLTAVPFDNASPLIAGSAEEADYKSVRRALNKVPTCPFCSEPTELRRVRSEGGDQRYRLALLCLNKTCQWNTQTADQGFEPLPFLLVDEDIYARAPAVVLGTIDKLALIGQYHSTISSVFGMFGLGRWAINGQDRISAPRDIKSHNPPTGRRSLQPLYEDGDQLFFDPLPALIIQDEAHLLEESLGAFAGLFETTLEQVFKHNSDLLGNMVVRRSSADGARGLPRMPKVIAATATVSDPARQTKMLYQRACRQFPYPGPDLYASFYSQPKAPKATDRRAQLETTKDIETFAPWSRVYVSFMTNGGTHTITSVNILAALHATLTGLLTDLWNEGDTSTQVAAVDLLIRGLTQADPVSSQRRQLLTEQRNQARFDLIASLVDLHRVALTYVTNKKGGDVVLDALQAVSRETHQYDALPADELKLDLISGGVDMEGIERVMRAAERSRTASGDFVPLGESLRNIVATSAISHGVDVDRFNAMIFAGIPSNIAEYIQASSRVGRTHVGFSLLVPTPQSRRDRYVVETHTAFHRFLERMISPPAIDRWAAHAVKRVMPSLFQAWLMGVIEPRLFANAPDKTKAPQFWRLDHIHAYLDPVERRKKLLPNFVDFVLGAIGVEGRGPAHIGLPANTAYYRTLVTREAHAMYDMFTGDAAELGGKLHEFWNSTTEVRRPMMSLRDVEDAGLITPAASRPAMRNDPDYQQDIEEAMKFLRRQRGDGSELDDEFGG